jgi:hypothetical protein
LFQSSSVAANLDLIAIGIEKINRGSLPPRAPARYRALANSNLICLQVFDDAGKIAGIDDQTKMIEVAIDFFANRTRAFD